MPENQTPPNDNDNSVAAEGEPKISPQPDLKQQEARPSEAEVAHAPNEAGQVRDPRLQTPRVRDAPANENRARLRGV